MQLPLTGLFLGAGASCEVGMPLVWELTRELSAYLTPEKLRAFNESWRSQGGGHPDSVIDDLCRILGRSDVHYESILGHLETQYRRYAPAGVQQQYHALYSWLIEFVYLLLYYRHTKNISRIEHGLRHLDGVAHLASMNSPLWVFSLNHDLIVECVAARHKIALNCGFTSEVVTLPRRNGAGKRTGDIRAEVISGEVLDKAAMPFLQPGSPGINLLKIHGALDVFTFRNGVDLLKLLPVEASVSGVIETLRAANEELFYVAPGFSGGRVINEIEYADEQGEMQFLRRSLLAGAFKFDAHREQVLPKRLLDHLRSNINCVSTLICIGYGFGNIHINQILREWLEFTADRRIEIVGPGVKVIPSFLLHLAPQVVLSDSNATDYLDRCAGITRSRLDKVEKRFAAWAGACGNERAQSEFQAFIERQQQHLVQAFADEVIMLPTRNGDIDREALGMPVEELARQLASEVIGTPEDLLEAFLDARDRVQSGPTDREVAEAAYLRWLDRGASHGGDRQDWFDAQRALKNR